MAKKKKKREPPHIVDAQQSPSPGRIILGAVVFVPLLTLCLPFIFFMRWWSKQRSMQGFMNNPQFRAEFDKLDEETQRETLKQLSNEPGMNPIHTISDLFRLAIYGR